MGSKRARSASQSGLNPDRKADFRAGATIAQHEVMGYARCDNHEFGNAAGGGRHNPSSRSGNLAALLGPGPRAGCYFYSMLRNNASGPEIGLPGRILAGLQPGKHRNQPSGRPSAGGRADFAIKYWDMQSATDMTLATLRLGGGTIQVRDPETWLPCLDLGLELAAISNT